MRINIISRYSYTLTDIITPSEYETVVNSNYDGKSQIVLYRKPNADEDDFILLHDSKSGYSYQGIIESIETEDTGTKHTVTVKELPRLFDQKIILSNEALLQRGIEDFIADQIRVNFIDNNDDVVNIKYLTVTAATHTPIAATVETENGGIYNLCTYIGNALTNYGIFIEFEFTPETLNVVIVNKEQTDFKIDTKIADVINPNESYEVQALTKLTVVWQYEKEAMGDEAAVKIDKIRHFFLKTDRTITEDMADPDRAKGAVDVLFSSAETEEKMIQEARNQFASNSYQHKISFDLISNSKLIPVNDVYIGHKCLVKTKSGIKNSFVSQVTRKNGSSILSVELGNMKVGLIEKLKGSERRK